ncbi:hypothetical protein HSIEG1_1323 [Enterococcus sp. HSIEG1]|nr:hypothetical protein HSIEG1_1323 [Enterococcus sp. HSIEG1]
MLMGIANIMAQHSMFILTKTFVFTVGSVFEVIQLFLR